MAATTPAKKKITRKSEKRYEMVSFEVPELFDGEFTFPSLQRAPLRVMMALEGGDMKELRKYLEYSPDADSVELFFDLDQTELEPVFSAWGKASGVEAPKSN